MVSALWINGWLYARHGRGDQLLCCICDDAWDTGRKTKNPDFYEKRTQLTIYLARRSITHTSPKWHLKLTARLHPPHSSAYVFPLLPSIPSSYPNPHPQQNQILILRPQHLISYPVISDSISTFKSNPYGAKSLSITTSLSHKLADPLLPYLTKPYQYVSPYITKADSLGDSTLSTIDSKFPVVKKPTGELIDNGKAIVFFPLKKGTEGKEYVVGVYGSECKKVGGEGIVTWGKAAIATGLVVGGDAYGWLSGFLAGKKAEAKEVSNEKLNN